MKLHREIIKCRIKSIYMCVCVCVCVRVCVYVYIYIYWKLQTINEQQIHTKIQRERNPNITLKKIKDRC